MKKILSIFLVGLLCFNTCVFGAGIDANTLAYWPANEGPDNATTWDDLSDNHDGEDTFNAQAKLDDGVVALVGDTTSLLLDGTLDHVAQDDSPDWILGGGQGDFTVEYWIYFGTSTGYPPMWGQDADTLNYYHSLILDSATYIFQVRSGGGDAKFDTRFTWNPADDTWYHVAIVREGTGANETKVYIDGVYQSNTLVTGAWDYTIPDLATTLNWGAIPASSIYLDGRMAGVRVSDIARWTENFTPPTEPYTADAPEPTPSHEVTSYIFGEVWQY